MYQSIYETNAGYPNWNIIIFGNITIRKETATDISTIQNKQKNADNTNSNNTRE